MREVAYTVRLEFSDDAVRDEAVLWLLGGHLQDVLDAGATAGELVMLEGAGETTGVEARYRFASREALDRYLREDAPRLREEGLARFGAARGVRMSRTIGELWSPGDEQSFTEARRRSE